MDRNKVIIRTSIAGIVTNLFLALFKGIIGLISGSIAVVLDAVNNFSDVMSSVITIVGTKLASKRPDKDHPMGHGRFEYLAGMAVSVIILFAGWEAFTDSLEKIIEPGDDPKFSTVSIIIISVAIVVKIVLGIFVRRAGKSVKSTALIGSGTDALFDAVLSTSVFASALLFVFFGIRIEAFVGVLISFFIIKTGIEMLSEAKDDILGRRTDDELKEKIYKVVGDDDAVSGVYDLVMHNYGHDHIYGSVHIEVPDVMQAEQIDLLERKIARKVYKETGVIITAIGIYSHNTSSDEVAALRANVIKIVHSHEGVVQTHGFYLNEEDKAINLDIILDYSRPDRDKIFAEITKELQEAYPDYKLYLVNDIDT